MKWPHPDALKDLVVEETDDGFIYSAPEGTECAKWLEYYNQTEELREEFKNAIMTAIKQYVSTSDGSST